MDKFTTSTALITASKLTVLPSAVAVTGIVSALDASGIAAHFMLCKKALIPVGATAAFEPSTILDPASTFYMDYIMLPYQKVAPTFGQTAVEVSLDTPVGLDTSKLLDFSVALVVVSSTQNASKMVYDTDVAVPNGTYLFVTDGTDIYLFTVAAATSSFEKAEAKEVEVALPWYKEVSSFITSGALFSFTSATGGKTKTAKTINTIVTLLVWGIFIYGVYMAYKWLRGRWESSRAMKSGGSSVSGRVTGRKSNFS